FDQSLMEHNIEYRSKRESGRLGEVRVRELAPGAYERIRRLVSDAGSADAQIKLSHLNPRSAVLEQLEILGSVKQI
ncbi:MAG: GH3 auxin-responsive promoter family protein, partial [Cyanobacteria bacterium HKST-UBA01]|nr:GH3 auxin-responsive promoter family protein [Cyanobacteria bacterium HKST-UBA01]